MKSCTKCGLEKVLDDFPKDANCRDGKGSWCKSCKSAYCTSWAQRNRPRLAALARNRYYHSETGRKYNRERQRKYRKENPEATQAQKRKDNLKRRSSLKTPNGGLTKAQWKFCLDLYNELCFYCGSAGKLSIDHIIAVSKGGVHELTNVVPACGPCNSKKNAKLNAEIWQKYLQHNENLAKVNQKVYS